MLLSQQAVKKKHWLVCTQQKKKQKNKNVSQLVGMVVSPADVKIVYRVVFPNQSLP